MPVIQKKSKEIKPARTITMSFLLIILVGTFLLMLPISSKDGSFTPLRHAFFTATSATCVTGLVIYDTFSKWTYFGQGVILAMIQIGGLGLVTFVTFFNYAIGKKLGLRRMQLASEAINAETFTDSGTLIKMIIKFSLAVEALGALVLMTAFIPRMGSKGIWTSVFLSISAFCNAGFDLLGGKVPFSSLSEYSSNPLVLFTIMFLIITGGIGFLAWYDLKKYFRTNHLEVHTKIVLLITLILIVSGAVVFAFSEWNNSLTIGNMNFGDKLMNSLFQSVTCRTAGFNSFDTSSMTPIGKIFSIMLMYIGAAPGSTGGGIKVTTIVVLIMTVVSILRNKDETIILGRRIDKNVVYRAITIAMLSIPVIFISAVTIFSSINKHTPVTGLDTTFEVVSAFATVGLSAGITSCVTLFAEILLCFVMLLGRVGTITLILSLTLNSIDKTKKQIVPEGKILVG